MVKQLWIDWLEKDKELSEMTEQERKELCKDYQWVCPKTKHLVELESIYSSTHFRRNRIEFKKWFYVVCGYLFSRAHLGENSYTMYSKNYQKLFNKKCTSKDFPSQILLVLALMGYIRKLDVGYSYSKGRYDNHGYIWEIDKERLKEWYSSLPDWEKSRTTTISFDGEGQDYVSSWTQHPDWLSERQYESISSVEVLEEGIKASSDWMFSFEGYQSTLSGKDKEDLLKEWVSYQKLRDLSIHKIGDCKNDNYAGRFYSTMTNMDSEHRHKYIRMDNERIVEVDVKNAQPTFLGIILYKETGVRSEWLNQALAGHLYEWIQEKTHTPEDRKTIKGWMMEYMYSCYMSRAKKDTNKQHKPLKRNKKREKKRDDVRYLDFQDRLNRFLMEAEPAIYEKIEYYKQHPEFREDKGIYETYIDVKGKKRKRKVRDGKWCSNLSCELVKEEVRYIQACIKRLPPDIKFWTIHDCICVKESRSMEVKAIMEEVSREMYGLTIKLKRENTSENYS